MRIAVLTSLYPGPSRPHEGVFAERRWLGMAARGHGVRIVHPLPRTPGPLSSLSATWAEVRALPEREERGGLVIDRPRYLHLPGRALGNARRFAKAGLAVALDPKPDVVVCDYAWPAAVAAHGLARRGVPCLVSGRGSDVLQVAGEAGLGPELASALRAAGHWCAVSRDLVEKMDELAGRPGAGRLVANGVDLERFGPGDRRAARRALGLPPERPLVLVVGHLIPRKDPLLALAAFRAGAPDDALLVFVGRGELAEELGREVRADGPDRVRLVGEVEPAQLATWYTACDLLLLTSRREGRPNVVLEALASGRPVLATPAGGTGELLEGLEERCLAPGRDPAVLGERLAALLADPPAEEDLRARVAGLSWDAGLSALEDSLRGAMAG